MSEIPEDILHVADDVWFESHDLIPVDAVIVIARAILAERERSRTALSEEEQRARREALEEAAILSGSIGDEQIRSGSLDLDASVDKIIVAIRALIPSEPHDAEVKPSWQDPSIFVDAEGRN